MWIRTQDKKELVNVIRVKIGHIYGDKTKKVCIWGYFEPDGFFSSNKVILGNYSSIEEAITEVDNIQKSISLNSDSVYQMKNS